MSSRLSASLSASSAMSSHTSSQSHVSLPTKRRSPPSKAWVDPMSLPDHGDISCISGNAPDYVKQLNYNTFVSYGVGDEDSFGYQVGNAVKFVDVSIDRPLERNGRMEATTTAELVVTKRKVTFNSTIRGRHLNLDSSVDMLNGAGMLHGAVVTYLIDNCCSTPLVVLGLAQNVNGVGVTQAMNVLFHSPAPLGTRLRIISTSISLGGRVMTSRCEIVDKGSGRVIASAFLNKMQPQLSKL